MVKALRGLLPCLFWMTYRKNTGAILGPRALGGEDLVKSEVMVMVKYI